MKPASANRASSRRAWAGGVITDSPKLDIAAAVVFVAGYWFLGPLAENRDAVARLSPEGYRSVVTLLAGMGSALLGLTLTAMAIVLAVTPGERLRVLLQHHRPTIVRSFAGAARALIALTFVSVYLLMFRYGGDPNRLLRGLLYGSLVLSSLAFVRLVYVLNYVLRIATIDKNDGTEGRTGPRPGRQYRNAS